MVKSSSLRPRIFIPIILLGLSGCSARDHTSVGPLIVRGTVHGGNNPISGSHIFLFSTGYYGYGSSTPILGTAITGSDGSFSMTANYSTCSNSQQDYIIATGGNPGLSGSNDNSAIVLVAALGSCANVNASTQVQVNEVTTVAAAFTLSKFSPQNGQGMTEQSFVNAASGGSVAGFSTSVSNLPGPAAAFVQAANIANVSTGQAIGAASSSTINALADILQDCVNSSSPASTACVNLFAAATPPASGGPVPVNVLQAALNIGQYPTNKAASLYGLLSPQGAFQPSLSAAPATWAIPGVTTPPTCAGNAGALGPAVCP